MIFVLSEENINRRSTLATTTAFLCLGVALPTAGVFAQQQSFKDQIVGTWTPVSSDTVQLNGTEAQLSVPSEQTDEIPAHRNVPCRLAWSTLH